MTEAASRQLILVTGPARSGKSEWAEAIAHDRAAAGKHVIYVATAQRDPADPDWQERISQHQRRRPCTWSTVEVPPALCTTIKTASSNQCLLIDSLGTWLANLLDQNEPQWNQTVEALCLSLSQATCDVVVVAEEAGWGVIPAYPIGRLFRDRLGKLTREIGSLATAVYLVTGGHVLNVSQLGTPLSILLSKNTNG